MKAKSPLLCTLLLALFSLSSTLYATESRSDGGGGDPSRERGGSTDRGSRGELNRDNDTQSAENISESRQHKGGHDVNTLGIGEPKDQGYSYHRAKSEMKGHD